MKQKMKHEIDGGLTPQQQPQTITFCNLANPNSFDCLEAVECPEQKQEENKMDAIARQEQDYRNYLERRLGDVREDKLTEAGKVFYTDGDEQPKTWPELLDR